MTENLIDAEACNVLKHESKKIYVIAIQPTEMLNESIKNLFIRELNIPNNFVDVVIYYNYSGMAFNVLTDPFECCFAVAGKVEGFEFSESYSCKLDFLEMQLIYKYIRILDDKVKSGEIIFRKYTP